MPSVVYLREFVKERLISAAEEILGVFNETIAEYQDVIDRQRELLDVVLIPEMKLHKIELSQQDVSQEEFLTDQQLCIQERNSGLDQEDPEPPQVKEEQEEPYTSQFVLKQETDAFMLTPTYGESDDNEDQTLDPDETLSAAENETVINMPVILSVVSEAHSDHQLLSHNSQDEHGDSGLTGNAEQKPKRKRQKSRRHINNHKKSVKCDICGKDFTQQSALQVHMRTHRDVKPYSCKTCGKDFRLKNSLYVHMRSHTDVKPYSCETCGKEYRLKNSLDVHVRTHTDVKPYSCKTCGKDFTRKYSLEVHMKTHTAGKPYSCNTCGKDFAYSRSVEVHMRTHTGERPYSCNTCEKSFFQIQHLKRHMQTHTDVKPYSCDTCEKRFHRMQNLKDHMQTHTDVKPYPCKICGKHFRNSLALKIHMRIHTGETPYSCKTCGKGFRQNVCLKIHMRKIHTGEKPHICKS